MQRKMIGLMILAVRSGTPPSLIAETYGPSRIHIPKAPALGLVLIGPQYNEYNRRIDESNKKMAQLRSSGKIEDKELADGTKDPVGVEGALLDKVNEFKTQRLYKPMREREHSENVYVTEVDVPVRDMVPTCVLTSYRFSKWLNYLDVLVGSDFESVFGASGRRFTLRKLTSDPHPDT